MLQVLTDILNDVKPSLVESANNLNITTDNLAKSSSHINSSIQQGYIDNSLYNIQETTKNLISTTNNLTNFSNNLNKTSICLINNLIKNINTTISNVKFSNERNIKDYTPNSALKLQKLGLAKVSSSGVNFAEGALDTDSIMDSMNLFRGAFLNLTNDRDISVFKPCINACDFVESKMREGMVFRGTFAKQFTGYMDEFVKDLNAWSGFTVQQKDDHYNDTLLASETFERWVKKGVEAIEKDVASSLRVSVKTLVDMMEEDISEVQTSIDLKEQKERENDNEN